MRKKTPFFIIFTIAAVIVLLLIILIFQKPGSTPGSIIEITFAHSFKGDKADSLYRNLRHYQNINASVNIVEYFRETQVLKMEIEGGAVIPDLFVWEGPVTQKIPFSISAITSRLMLQAPRVWWNSRLLALLSRRRFHVDKSGVLSGIVLCEGFCSAVQDCK